ncbi:D-aminoacyl-tRNA deacylase [Porticoccus sp.]|jgi:D-tyrosyl-tRNA(Tyr) deacylase|uniref:D-aminoacyl-tRNA deacylase n=1 Tax=Porticoccus sp. TaxID=2024853 RepID=UPI000C5D2262|nr:D-aminoacyl-tRNA deacylase [Porticoccus sp.]MAZ69421.1 D-tyrosyl-tRNA(Tyr) deacylase [Porticoccus sp.]|tara:strand:- start:10429 stop:10866 length:438 start_codon:yes stop_codon:yes gene_type:complete
MLGLIQRVSYATVEVNGDRMGEIGPGILLLLGVQAGDSEGAAARLLHKVLNYRIFPDDGGRMNLNLQQMGGGLMVVSQFTLAADTGKGLRPGFSNAAPPERAEALYDYFISRAEQLHPDVASGVFGANMQVSLCNDGPVTFMLEG